MIGQLRSDVVSVKKLGVEVQTEHSSWDILWTKPRYQEHTRSVGRLLLCLKPHQPVVAASRWAELGVRTAVCLRILSPGRQGRAP